MFRGLRLLQLIFEGTEPPPNSPSIFADGSHPHPQEQKSVDLTFEAME